MKTFSADQDQPPIDRSKAWSYLITNLLVLPGLGSLMAKRKVGYIQIPLGLGGFCLTLIGLVQIALAWAHTFEFPADRAPYLLVVLGIVVFLAAWGWSLATSLALFRKP